MSGLSKVIVVVPEAVALDARTARQLKLGFEREGVPATIESASGRPAAPPEDTGLVVVSGSGTRALELVRKTRTVLDEQKSPVPLVFAGTGVTRPDATTAGADEVVLLPTFLRDVVTVGRLLQAQPAGPRTALVGSLAETTGVYTLVRALCALGRSAVLTLIRGLRRGEIRFFRGEVTSAQVGLIHGQAAFHQLLLWTEARFEFHHEDVVRRQQIPLTPDELFTDAERFLEGVRDASGSLSPSLVLEQDVAKIHTMSHAAGTPIPTEVLGVLRMFDGHRVLADVLEDSPYRVFETLRVAQRAVEVGLLRIVEAQRAKKTWRAVLRIEEWLVGNERPKVEDTGPIGKDTGPVAKDTGPVPQQVKSSGSRRNKRKKKSTAPPIVAAPVAPPTKPEIDWGSLVPRVVGAELAPLSGVVPAAQLSGEIVLPPTREAPREKLEALMDTERRDRIFPKDAGIEPKVVFDDSQLVDAEVAATKRAAEIKQSLERSSQNEIVMNTVSALAASDQAVAVKVAEARRAAADKAATDKAAADKAAADKAAADKAAADKAAADKAAADKAAADKAAADKAAADKPAAPRTKTPTAEQLLSALPPIAPLDGVPRAKSSTEPPRAKTPSVPPRTKSPTDAPRSNGSSATITIPLIPAPADGPSRMTAAEKAAAENAALKQAIAEKAATEKAAAEKAAAEKAAAEAATDKAATDEAATDRATAEAEAKARAEAKAEAEDAALRAEAAEWARVQATARTRAAEAQAREAEEIARRVAQTRASVEEPRLIGRDENTEEDAEDAEIWAAAKARAEAEDRAKETASLTAAISRVSLDDDENSEAPPAPVVQATPPPRPKATSVPPPIPDDRPEARQGEIVPQREKRPTAEPLAGEPSILVADLAAAHVAVASVASVQAQAPATPDLASASTSLSVSDVRQGAQAAIAEAATAFTDAEEAFFRAGHERPKSQPEFTAPVETFDDLDEGYQPVGFWDRLRGKKPPKK